MKQTKRRMEPFTFFNIDGICTHLEKMALNGWMLEKISNFGWSYRRIEPRKIRFSVSYFPKASEFDPEPTEAQQRFIDFCDHTGWKLVCTSAQMQIFYNERLNPTPIETEPVLEIEAIHASAKKGFIPVYIFLFVLRIFQGGLWISSLLGNPIDLLANPAKLFTGLCWLLVFLLCIVEVFSYFIWYRKAKRIAKQGNFLSPPNTANFQKVLFVIVAIGFFYWIFNMLIVGDSLQRWTSVIMCFYVPVLFAVTNGTKIYLKQKKASRGFNRIVTSFVSFLCSLVIMGTIAGVTLFASSRGFFDTNKVGSYEHNGIQFSIYDDELPLTVEDLRSVNYDGYIKERRGNQSVFLSEYVMRQHARFDAGNYAEIPQLEYTIVGVRMPFIYNMCKERMKYEEEQLRSYHPGRQCVSVPENASDWYANEVFRFYDSIYGFSNSYLLCYDNLLIAISFDWEPTPEQMKIVGERFSGK